MFFYRWHNQELTIKLPLDLSTVLEIYLSVGHAVLKGVARCPTSQFMFVDKKGRPFAESQSMTHFWQDFLKKMGCRVIFPPHRYIPLKTCHIYWPT